ncbi:DNRLRE domain-containing protein [Olleya sp. YS]|uniref:DNRLRE domain-containing protein n=1 Tax=Olleya sp. YS TaxID=3028318 RepID=UPI00243455F7|nr:DNRLRE domain-containing protein [Olleya sp. YS]WGD35773.1 DNRLRE domain-containing protein [Olleya sp. YS]
MSCNIKTSNVYIPNSQLGIDTYIDSEFDTKNFSSDKELKITNFSFKDSTVKENRSLLKIRCSSIPKKAIVDSAFLYLYISKSEQLESPYVIDIENIVEDWDVTSVNWFNQPKTDSKVVAQIIVKEEQRNYYKVDLTQFIRALVDEKFSNYGLMFKTNLEKSKSGIISFLSSDTKDLDSRPKLKVYFNQNIF